MNLAKALPCIGAVVIASGCAGANLLPAPGLGTSFDIDPAVHHATYVVTSTADHGKGSLRTTIAAAKPNAVITFKLKKKTSTITLSGAIEITKSVTITGPGATSLTVASNGARLLTIDPKTNVSITGVTFSRGSATQGGAILNTGTLK
ncbi:MAG TPA: hypothetical protein VK760_00055, partial [Candidatus Acidoferrales bacterium]|nr:hypothetical protein [Candidatus Acidoferrales bacterium]